MLTLFSGVIQNGALCYASMGSHGLDTKTTLSVSDITAISPAMLLLFAFNSLFFLCLRVLSFSEHTACIRHTLCSLFKMYIFFFWQLPRDKERKLHWILKWKSTIKHTEDCGKSAKTLRTSSSTAQPSQTMVDISNVPFLDHPGDGGLNHMLHQEWSTKPEETALSSARDALESFLGA